MDYVSYVSIFSDMWIYNMYHNNFDLCITIILTYGLQSIAQFLKSNYCYKLEYFLNNVLHNLKEITFLLWNT